MEESGAKGCRNTILLVVFPLTSIDSTERSMIWRKVNASELSPVEPLESLTVVPAAVWIATNEHFEEAVYPGASWPMCMRISPIAIGRRRRLSCMAGHAGGAVSDKIRDCISF